MRTIPLLGLLLIASCGLIPNSVVRVALPERDTQAAQEWAQVAERLRASGETIPLEVVAPGSFPPPDLVWFSGNFEDPQYLSQALAPSSEVAQRGAEALLSRAWFDVAGDRLYPLAWNPWGWWAFDEGARIPQPETGDDRALAAFEQRTSGPQLGSGSTVASRQPGKVWLSLARVRASAERTSLRELPSEVVVARVKGFWWNAQGWNPRLVPELLSRLWSPEVQALYQNSGEWVSVREAVSPALRTILVVN